MNFQAVAQRSRQHLGELPAGHGLDPNTNQINLGLGTPETIAQVNAIG